MIHESGARPADEIVRVGRLLYTRKYVVAAEGNLSIRLDRDHFMITPTGVCKGDLSPTELVEMNLGGDVAGSARPSSEWRLHAEIYRRRGDIGAVCHGHPPCATAFACARRPLPSALMPEALLLLGDEVHLAPYATPGTDEVPASLRGLTDDESALLLANHGVVTFAATLDTAYALLETVERLAEVALHAETLGGGVRLTRREGARIRER
ncbi:class II aldolase/adducin family protein [bacterium]|nr:class II aldolase/adducin family protein [bacterium]